MAATDRGSARALMAAALALPGIAPATAQTMPDEGVVSLRYLDYRDWQPGANRMHVQSPSLFVMKPFGGSWVAEGSLVYDAMSGASPRYYNVQTKVLNPCWLSTAAGLQKALRQLP